MGQAKKRVGGLLVDAQASGSDERKPPSATADKAGTRGHYGARQGQGGHDGVRQEFEGAEPSRVGVKNGGYEASGVDPKSHGVGGGGGL